MKKSDLALTLAQRLLLLLCIFLVCYIITFGCAYLLGRVLAGKALAAVRISAVVQDVLAFIVPAIATALMVTRKPAELLAVATKPSIFAILAMVVAMVVSVPAQEAIIYWNEHLQFSGALAEFAAQARALDDMAQETMRSLMADTSVATLIVNILIIGVFAGLSEELLFRGCFQRLLTTSGVNRHVAVWVVAFCFSAMHFQLFGFVPRMLLGAFFGYLLLWTGSVWTPVAAHILNNSAFVVSAWLQVRADGVGALTEEATPYSPLMITISVLATAATLYLMWRNRVTN